MVLSYWPTFSGFFSEVFHVPLLRWFDFVCQAVRSREMKCSIDLVPFRYSDIERFFNVTNKSFHDVHLLFLISSANSKAECKLKGIQSVCRLWYVDVMFSWRFLSFSASALVRLSLSNCQVERKEKFNLSCRFGILTLNNTHSVFLSGPRFHDLRPHSSDYVMLCWIRAVLMLAYWASFHKCSPEGFLTCFRVGSTYFVELSNGAKSDVQFTLPLWY